ncbi:hypothetical protein [Actinomadura fibrosa]|uniref:Uncharacterized protein n=1 Tax=Actinomadura fibrosa TaxID=111802 RepID=A0ABW2Y3P3_9ACTN|nr:hypothetical protein [Actinomadura fibrosa]
MADEAASSRYDCVPRHTSLIQNLNDFLVFCGKPSLGDIKRISKQLAARYGPRYATVDELPTATVSAVLAGKRKRPPKQAWLVAFVLSCEWYAWTEGAALTEWADGARRTGPPDPEKVLACWIEEHQAVQYEAVRHPAAPHDAVRERRHRTVRPVASPADPVAAVPVSGQAEPPADRPPALVSRQPPPVQRPLPPPPSGDGAVTPSYGSFSGHSGTTAMREAIGAARPGQVAGPPMDASQRRIRQAFGVLGLQLYDRAEEGHVEAAFRLGALLCADLSTTEGRFYLEKTKDRRHSRAAALCRIREPERLRQRALRTVYAFARAAHTDNEVQTAVSYCAVAARNDHADAAHMLATLLTALNQPELADRYLRHAAALGHSAARDHVGPDGTILHWSDERAQQESIRLLARIAPEPRFDSANATQPIDMAALFAKMKADELAEAVQRTLTVPPKSPARVSG